MFSFPFNIAYLYGVGSNGREKNNVIHDLSPRRQLQHKWCLRKQDNLFVWSQLCDPWPVLIFSSGYMYGTFVPRWKWMLKKQNKTKHYSSGYFSSFIADSLKTIGVGCKFSFFPLGLRIHISCFLKVIRIFLKSHLSWGFGMLLGICHSKKTSWRNVEMWSHLAAGPLSHRL